MSGLVNRGTRKLVHFSGYLVSYSTYLVTHECCIHPFLKQVLEQQPLHERRQMLRHRAGNCMEGHHLEKLA
jgi:hypothetical protein